MNPLMVGEDEFITLTIGTFTVKDPDFREDLGGLDGAELDEVYLDEQ